MKAASLDQTPLCKGNCLRGYFDVRASQNRDIDLVPVGAAFYLTNHGPAPSLRPLSATV